MWHLLCAIAHRLHAPVKKKQQQQQNNMNYFVINLWLQEWHFQWQSHLYKATFSYENMSVLIRQNYYKE